MFMYYLNIGFNKIFFTYSCPHSFFQLAKVSFKVKQFLLTSASILIKSNNKLIWIWNEGLASNIFLCLSYFVLITLPL